MKPKNGTEMTPEAITAAMEDMVAEGFVRKSIRANGEVCYSLTADGTAAVKESMLSDERLFDLAELDTKVLPELRGEKKTR